MGYELDCVNVVHLQMRLHHRKCNNRLSPLKLILRCRWDIDYIIDLDKNLRLLGGQAILSLVGSGLVSKELISDPATTKQSASLLSFNITSLSFSGRGSSLATYPVASSSTSARFPRTASWLESRLGQYRSWMSLKLSFKFPTVLGIVVDSDAVSAYSRVFSSLIKVCI